MVFVTCTLASLLLEVVCMYIVGVKKFIVAMENFM